MYEYCVAVDEYGLATEAAAVPPCKGCAADAPADVESMPATVANAVTTPARPPGEATHDTEYAYSTLRVSDLTARDN